jgi:hypothetical protein
MDSRGCAAEAATELCVFRAASSSRARGRPDRP